MPYNKSCKALAGHSSQHDLTAPGTSSLTAGTIYQIMHGAEWAMVGKSMHLAHLPIGLGNLRHLLVLPARQMARVNLF